MTDSAIGTAPDGAPVTRAKPAAKAPRTPAQIAHNQRMAAAAQAKRAEKQRYEEALAKQAAAIDEVYAPPREAKLGSRSTNGARRTRNPRGARVITEADLLNPYLDAPEFEVLPKIEPDPRYAYLWMRVSVGGVPDGGNIHLHTGGRRLRYEVVRPDDMPDLRPLSSTQVQMGPCIQVKDVILVRCPRKEAELYERACRVRAYRQFSEVKRSSVEEFRDMGGPSLEIEDKETVEYVDE